MDFGHIDWNSPEGKLAIEISELWDRMDYDKYLRRWKTEKAKGIRNPDTRLHLGLIDGEVNKIAGHLSPEKLSEVLQLATIW